MTQSWYHIVVVGTELAGLVYAALAARMGYRVLVIGQGERPNAYKREGFWFLRRPELYFGFATSPSVMRALSELSLGLEMKNRPQPLEPAFQVAMPGMRLDVGGVRRLWERDLERELPGAQPRFDAFEQQAAAITRASNAFIGPGLRATPSVARGLGIDKAAPMDGIMLPPRGLREKAAFRRVGEDLDALGVGEGDARSDWLGERFDDDRARAVIEAPLSHFSGLLGARLAPVSVARLWTHLRAGLHRFPGGLDGLKQVFIRKVKDLSCDYRPDAFAQRLVMKRGKVTEVVLAERGEAIGCDLVVGNVEPHRVMGLIGPDDRDEGWHALVTGREPVAWRLVVNLGVDARVLPRGMAPELVWVRDGRERLTGDNNLWISRPGIGPHSGGDGRPGPGVVQVSALLEARAATPTLGGIQRTVTLAVDAVRGLVPWLDEHLKVVDVPALKPQLRDGKAVEPVIELDELQPVYGDALPDTLGLSAFSPETPYKNMILTGDQLFAGLGFEGACLSALQAIAHTQERVKLRSGLRGDRSLV